MGEILYGTSSWSEKSWVGPFYPEGTRATDFLARYAEHFTTVEADVTYYRVPDARMVEGWRTRTPDGFRLAAKFPRSVVHAGEGPRPDGARLLVPEHVAADTEQFLGVMSLLGDKCGPLVLQFPYFNKTVFPDKGEFLERLDAYLGSLPPDFRYAVELRNKWWLDRQLTALLARHRTALVLVDIAYMPHPADLHKRLDLVTTDFCYARLIGDRKQIDALTKTFDAIVVDKSKSLARWAGLLSAIAERVTAVHVYANNHYAGHGPATIRQLAGLVSEVRAPGA